MVKSLHSLTTCREVKVVECGLLLVGICAMSKL